MLNDALKTRIDNEIASETVVLFMKGTPVFPQCGFSSNVVETLKKIGVNNLATVNVLDDQDVRQGIKDFSNWPTIPQLYINGEFIGGSDIINEMFENGELKELLEKKNLLSPTV